VSREALLERAEFEEFLNDITLLDSPPDGFYLLVGSRGAGARTDIFHADVIARWMLLNYSLNINGFEVINGYSDVVTPFLGVAGGAAGACGWYSNLRVFSLDRYQQSQGGGRQPIPRYLSADLLNRVTFAEREALAAVVANVNNGLQCDGYYDPEPDRGQEILQSWETISSLCKQMVRPDVAAGLVKCSEAVAIAEATYWEIANAGIRLDRKSNNSHLDSLREGIRTFRAMTNINE